MAISNVIAEWASTPENEQERKRAHEQQLAETGKKEAELERLREREARGELTPNEQVRMAHLTGEDEDPTDGGAGGAGARTRARQPGLDSDTGHEEFAANLSSRSAGTNEESELLKREGVFAKAIDSHERIAKSELTSRAHREQCRATIRKLQLEKLALDSPTAAIHYVDGQLSRVA